MPLDALTAARLARDGEKASPIRHMCSGQHAVSLLLSRLQGLGPRDVLAARAPLAGRVSIGGRACLRHDARTSCARRSMAVASQTYAFRLREVAQAYAMLADPAALPADDPARRSPSRSSSCATRCWPTRR